jgi:hypothetical protein
MRTGSSFTDVSDVLTASIITEIRSVDGGSKHLQNINYQAARSNNPEHSQFQNNCLKKQELNKNKRISTEVIWQHLECLEDACDRLDAAALTLHRPVPNVFVCDPALKNSSA